MYRKDSLNVLNTDLLLCNKYNKIFVDAILLKNNKKINCFAYQINDCYKSSLIEKYGQWIVYDPGLSKNTLLLWALPLLLFLIGGAIIVKRILKNKYE